MEEKEKFVAKIGAMYGKVMSLRDDDDYLINQPQMEKLVAIIEFFSELEKDSVKSVDIIPREEHGGVEATFSVFDIYGDNIARFCNVLSGASAMTIDCNNDSKVCISITVPSVFVSTEK